MQTQLRFSSAPPVPKLRYYQHEAIAGIHESFTEAQSTLVVMATGLGKTMVFVQLAMDWTEGDVLVLAHRDELLRQAQERFTRYGVDTELEQADLKASKRAHIVIASIDTIRSTKRLAKFDPKRFGLIICDEVHHYVGNTYVRPLDYFRDAKRVGFTATPDRGDEQAMGKQWESVSYVRDILDGIEDGYLVPIKARPITDCNVHLDKVKKTAGDLQAGALDEAMLQAVEPVCKKILELEPDRRGILFFPGVRSAALASERMNQLRPGSAVFISGTTPTDERRRAIERCRRGERRYLCNCQVATEGFDWAEANLIAMARPTMSRALYAQMAGRGTRVLPGTVEHLDGAERAAERRSAIAASAKPDMMILDFIDAQSKHTLVTPLDILGGKFTEDELKEAKLSAKKKQSQSYDQLALLNEARSQIAHLSTTNTTVTARVGELYDPFSALGMKQGTRAEMTRLNSRFGKEPITPGQLTYLERTLCTKRGMTSAEVAQLSKREASKLITELVNRQKAGKATFKQLAILRDFGWDDTSVSMAQATAAIDFISSVRWNKNRATPADICRVIANAPTERRPPPPKPQPQYEDDLPW